MQQDATNIALTTTTTMVMMMKKMSSWQRVDRDAMIGWSEAWRRQWRQWSHFRPASDCYSGYMSGDEFAVGVRWTTTATVWLSWSGAADAVVTSSTLPEAAHVPQQSTCSCCILRLVVSLRHSTTSRYAVTHCNYITLLLTYCQRLFSTLSHFA